MFFFIIHLRHRKQYLTARMAKNILLDFTIKKYVIDPRRVILVMKNGMSPSEIRSYFQYNIMSIAQCCEVLRISPSTITRRLEQGTINACRPFPNKKNGKIRGPIFIIIDEVFWEWANERFED